jgi:Ca2+/H+ antiporter
MKVLKTLLITGLTWAALPALASVESRSANACAQALAKQVSGATAVTRPYRIDYLSSTSASMLASFYAARLTFDMKAHDASGAELARATCVTDRSGNVKSLELAPAGSSQATYASNF